MNQSAIDAALKSSHNASPATSSKLERGKRVPGSASHSPSVKSPSSSHVTTPQPGSPASGLKISSKVSAAATSPQIPKSPRTLGVSGREEKSVLRRRERSKSKERKKSKERRASTESSTESQSTGSGRKLRARAKSVNSPGPSREPAWLRKHHRPTTPERRLSIELSSERSPSPQTVVESPRTVVVSPPTEHVVVASGRKTPERKKGKKSRFLKFGGRSSDSSDFDDASPRDTVPVVIGVEAATETLSPGPYF